MERVCFALPAPARGRKVTDVVLEVKELHEALSAVEQEQAAEGMRGELCAVAERLVAADLLAHSDKTVRLLVSCCLANVLRLFAPDAPYTARQLKDVFATMAQQLRALADDKNVYYSYVFYLLESLVTVKSIVLLLDVDDTAGDRDRLLLHLFTLALSLAPHPTLAQPAKLYLLEMLQTLLEECDAPSPAIVRLLVQKCSDVRSETRTLALTLVRLCSDKLQPSLGLHLNEAIVGYAAGGAEDGDAKQRLDTLRQTHEQLVSVGCAAPAAVASVIAQIEEELRVESVDVRSLALGSLAAFFAAPGEDVTVQYAHTWHSWLQKMNDKAASVRVLWSKLAVSLLPKVSPSSGRELQLAIAEKLQDFDGKVREKTLLYLRNLLNDQPASLIGAAVYEEVQNRCRDKVEEVRFVAMDLQCELVRRLALEPAGDAFPAAVNALLRLIYTNDRDLRIFYEYFIEHSVFISGADVAEQARLMVAMFRVMGEEACKAFRKWLNDKSRFVKYFGAFVSIATASPDDQRLATVAQHLADLFRMPLEAQGCLQAIARVVLPEASSRRVFEQLVSPETDVARLRKHLGWVTAQEWAVRDARLKDYLVAFLARRASFLSISNELISEILGLAEGELEGASKRLVEEIIAEFPVLGIKHSGLLEELIINTADNHGHLVAYSRFVAACPTKITPSPRLREHLQSLLEGASRRQVKLSVRIMALLSSASTEWESMMEGLLPTLTRSAVRSWQIVSELAKDRPQQLVPHTPQLIAITEGLFGGEGGTAGPLAPLKKFKCLDEHSESTQCMVLAVRCLRNILLSLRAVNKELEMSNLRTVAPLLVEWIGRVEDLRVRHEITKTLLLLVPRPTTTTMTRNLGPIMDFAQNSPPAFQEKINSTILRQYSLGNIGMVYLGVPVVCSSQSSKTVIRDSLCLLRKNDRFSDVLVPQAESSVEITSRSLRSYEDWFVVTLIIAACQHLPPTTEEERVSRYCILIDILVDVVVTEMNISFLFDAVVQLKQHRVASEEPSASRNLYVLSEIAQNTLRGRATRAKWALQSVRVSLRITDELLEELFSVEETNRVMQKSYLTRVVQKSERARRTGTDENIPTLPSSSNEGQEWEPSDSAKVQMQRRSERKKTRTVLNSNT